jgi:hypothetical protein
MYGYNLGLAKARVSESVPAAPANVVQPLLVGNGAVGSVVTCNPGAWSGSPSPTFVYDFRIDGSSVQSGASNTYTPLIGDDTKTLTCLVTATNTEGSASEGASNSLVVGTIPVNTVAPVVSGTNTFGSTLTTTNGTFTGTATITFTYQWLRNGSQISGQTASTYVIGASDSLANITCSVTGTNSYGSDSEVSNTITVQDFAPINTVAPTVSPSGTQSTGTLITADVESWDGVAPITFEYKWTRDGIAISGATASTYTIQLADDGTTIRVEVKGTNAYGTSAFIASSNSVSAVNSVAPTNSVAPVISGTAVVGQTLTTTDGTWDGIPTPTYSYQWKRGATNIGTNADTYTLVQADAGNTSNITCVVTATNAGGSANATSNQIARILDTLTDTYITGLTLTSGEIDSFNTLYLALRSNNYHTEIDRLNIYGSATQSAANKSLFGSFTATPINSPTWSRKVGYTHTGTSAINSNYTISTQAVKFTLDNHVLGNRHDNKNNVTLAFTGAVQTVSPAVGLQCAVVGPTGVSYASLATQNANVFTGRTTQSKFAIRRLNSTGYTAYMDNSTQAITQARVQPLPSISWYDGARNLDGAVNFPVESGVISVYSYHGSSVVVPTTLNTILDNFISSL